MATKKDLAFDHFMTAGNPVKKRKAPAKRKPKTAAEKYITKKSQITGKTPTERLKKRREKNTETGYFSNPLQIDTGNELILDGKRTGIYIFQRPDRTYAYDSVGSEIPLKRARYTTSTEKGMVDLKIDLFGRKNNPISSSDIKLSDIERLKYFVQEKTASGWLSLAAFHELDDAKEFATLISESGNVPIRVAA